MDKLKKLHLFFLLCCLLNCERSFDPLVSQPADPPEPEKRTVPPVANLVFVKGVDEGSDIFFLDTLGYEKRLTYGGMNPNHIRGLLEFSPDGSKIAFSSNKTGNTDIYIMNVDGSELRTLTSHSAQDELPQFSPDGSSLIFESDRNGNWEIYSIHVDGTALKNLINNISIDVDGTFSPDGSKITFSSNRDGNFEVYIMDADGQHQQNLTNFPGGNFSAHDYYPEFSPVGTKIMFISGRDLGENLYIMESNGNNQKLLTRAGQFWGLFFEKVFSKDSQYIIYEQHNLADFQPGIYRIDIEGMDHRQLWIASGNFFLGAFPALSPDGSKIAFHSNIDGIYNLYQMNTDGTEQVRLTDNETSDLRPIFQPVER